MHLQEVSNFNKLFEVSNDLICLVNKDGLFKKVNPAFQNILGYQQMDLINKSIFTFIHQDDKLLAKNEFENVYKIDIKIVNKFFEDKIYKPIRISAKKNLFIFLKPFS